MSKHDNPLLDPSLPQPEKELLAIRIYFDLFNRGQYYECHDVMEEIWMETPGPERRFFQGLLQCAVALHHLGNGNPQGARILYQEGTRKLQRFRPNYLGVDVAGYLADLETRLPERIRGV